MPKETLLAERINKSFMNAVDEAVKRYSKKRGNKRVSEREIKEIVTDALVSYKNGIIEALRVNSILEEIEKVKTKGQEKVSEK